MAVSGVSEGVWFTVVRTGLQLFSGSGGSLRSNAVLAVRTKKRRQPKCTRQNNVVPGDSVI